jgi:polar amino acid transport system substrate-binding protein
MSTGNARTAFGQPARMAVVLMAVAMFVAACGGSTASVSPSASADTSCAPENLALKTAGVLTLSTDFVGYSPWFEGGNEGDGPWGDETGENNDPSNGEGFEGALATEIATRLGFKASQVQWIPTTFNQSYVPGPKNFDIFINQVSITDERATAVDFSEGYYEVKQAVISIAGTDIAGATSLQEIRDSKLGTQIGTTSYTAIVDVVRPTVDVSVFDTMDEATAALEGGLIDGLVADLPTAWVIKNFFISDGIMLGTISGAVSDQFGLVLEKGSRLTACVNSIIAEMKSDGTIESLIDTWIPKDLSDVPELQ